MEAFKAKLSHIYSKLPLSFKLPEGQEHQLVSKLSEKFDLRILILGLLGIFSFYAALYAYVSINASSTVIDLESKLQSITVLLDNQREEENTITHVERMVIPENLKIDGLSEKTQFGNLPIIRKKDNLTSFRAYANIFNFDNLGDKPMISFVIDDFGLSKKNAMAALDILPPEVTFIVSPYSHMPSEWVSLARDKGHEVWFNLPIQNDVFQNSGKDTIFHHLSFSQKRDKFRNTISKATGYVGIASYTDNTILSEAEHYGQIGNEIYTRGLGFLDLNPNPPPLFAVKAVSSGAPYMKADMRLKFIQGEKNSFESLENLAKLKSHLIVVVDNTPNMIKQLAVWIMKVGHIDYIIAPVSAGYDLPLHRDPHTETMHH